MKKSSLWVLFIAAIVAVIATPAFAENAAKAVAEVAVAKSAGANTFYLYVALATIIAMLCAAVGIAWAQCSAVKTAIDGIARNPGAASKILPSLLIGLAMIESLAIYVLVIALILLFANPFIKLIG